MRIHLVAAAVALGLASPALAQSRAFPAASQAATQPPIDWAPGAKPAARWHDVFEGRSAATRPFPPRDPD